MKLDTIPYTEFYFGNMRSIISTGRPLRFKYKEIQWAMRAVKAGIFDGDECWDQKHITLDILVWCAQEVLNGRNK